MTNYKYDAELAPYIPLIPSVIDFSTAESIRGFWAKFKSMNPPPDNLEENFNVSIEDKIIQGLEEDTEIRLRLYRPNNTPADKNLAAIYEIHGGGFIIGDLEMQDMWCAKVASEANALVVSVDYRLAPENPYPAAPNDCYAGFCWLFDNAAALGVDCNRIAIVGQSAGACLALSTSLRARDLKGPKACLQVLEIPVVDDRLETISMKSFTDTPMWNYANAQWSWKHYLGDTDPNEIPYYASPARADDYKGLPSTYISTMEFDPLRDEGIQLGLRLMEAGVTVELHSYPGTFHGSNMIFKAKVSQRSSNEVIETLKRNLE